MEKINLDKGSLRKFGITMGIAFMVITLLIFIKHKHNITPTLIISGLFFAVAVLIPLALRPVYIVWMHFAYILGWINTRLILAILFYLLFTPIGIFMRMLGRDLLDRRIAKDSSSYWKKKEAKTFNSGDYERQF